MSVESVEKNTSLFSEGKHCYLHKFLGSFVNKEKKETTFRIWAPNARSVSVVGNFNLWFGENHRMKNLESSGIWEIKISNLSHGELYKYRIEQESGKIVLKSDPMGRSFEIRPNNASKVYENDDYIWDDYEWILKREKINYVESPLNIYEVHLGSFKRKDDNSFYNYREVAHILLNHVKKMNYNFIELMPINEHPFDGSWGYQATGYFAPTSRYGNPEDLKYMINLFHRNNIGVILDWVPGHFCRDEHGLYKFDGTNQYEYSLHELENNDDWGTSNFDLGKREIHSFFISNACYWIEEFHIDGFRVDAVSNMIYLNYGKRKKFNLRNSLGGYENIDGINFIKKINGVIKNKYRNIIMIAEESTAFKGITKRIDECGLGFDFKWNMGWMNDILSYMSMGYEERKYNISKLTFPLMYAFDEKFILPLSHDEVVHLKKSLLEKMPGNEEEKFLNLTLLIGFMLAFPGKKTLFMGGDIGQDTEWNYNASLQWDKLSNHKNKKLNNKIIEINNLYSEENALYELDNTTEGFQWNDFSDNENCIISFTRKSKEQDEFILVLCNFSNRDYEDYKLYVPRFLIYEEIFNSSIEESSSFENKENIHPIWDKSNCKKFFIEINIPKLSVIYLKPKKYGGIV